MEVRYGPLEEPTFSKSKTACAATQTLAENRPSYGAIGTMAVVYPKLIKHPDHRAIWLRHKEDWQRQLAKHKMLRAFYVCVALGLALLATGLVAVPISSANWGLNTSATITLSLVLIAAGVCCVGPMSYYTFKASMHAHMENHVNAALEGRHYHEKKPEQIELVTKPPYTSIL